MVPAHLADIFCTPDMAPQTQPTKRRRITRARVLTENEYIHMMEKDAKEREAEELNKKRKEERERKKEEREKQERERGGTMEEEGGV